jgi:hypothetical protein
MDKRYELITPTGESLMRACLSWQQDQAKPENATIYAKPAQCANNISKVFSLAGLSHYKALLISDLLDIIIEKGGQVIQLSKSQQDIASLIHNKFQGKLPTGALVAGFKYADMSGNPGDGHVAMIGGITESGALQVYHNNWYRPPCKDGSPSGSCIEGWDMEQWVEHMLPKDWLNTKDTDDEYYQRKFMATPWVNIMRQPTYTGMPYSINVELPEIDDLDPTHDFIKIGIPIEIISELNDDRYIKILNSSGQQIIKSNASN